ncbi:MAG TPA: peptide chain release factor 1 [Bacillota bacterium]|nr:peptide chain release factor 1 [Bacillota bacterium]HPF42946.1 peptide chain release factor 1 [Bacillota bacterium]HPJ86424.1 peptide chain release factor 1 [Bacillota bacterium]HPQ62216.1 peptide chain release factor 1 [Bacillota bacterium]HRX92137.1 peptide chain release factor 1 [Candidatus Izemoplasmatales bacterium]
MLTERLDQIESKYNEISKQLMDPAVSTDIKKATELAKELSSLEKFVVKYREYLDLQKQIRAVKSMQKDQDPEIREMAELELEELQQKILDTESELEIMLVPKDPNDEKNVIVEIRGAAGGDEGNIFGGDLFRMYVKYAEAKGWKVEVLYAEPAEAGGYSQIEFMIKGDGVYSLMKYESGVHRVQRVPQTESQGRIHTSTATVLVVPEAEEMDFDVDMEDVRVDTFCSSGPGGQSVNTTKSAVRLTHIPSGLVVQCQDGKSQHENKASALKILRSRLYDKMLQEKLDKEGKERKSKIGTGDRSEKIRTYNYPQNRVTDHRIGFTIQQLDRVIEGKLDPIIEALVAEEQKRNMEAK